MYYAEVACLQETNLGQQGSFKVAGYHTVYNRQGHGQTIHVKSTIKFRELDVGRWTSDDLHLVAVELMDQPVQNVVNVYACNSTMDVDKWMQLDDMLQTLHGKTLLVGDFNARGAAWGNVTTNPQGLALETALDQSGLVCINDGRVTRMASRSGDTDSH